MHDPVDGDQSLPRLEAVSLGNGEQPLGRRVGPLEGVAAAERCGSLPGPQQRQVVRPWIAAQRLLVHLPHEGVVVEPFLVGEPRPRRPLRRFGVQQPMIGGPHPIDIEAGGEQVDRQRQVGEAGQVEVAVLGLGSEQAMSPVVVLLKISVLAELAGDTFDARRLHAQRAAIDEQVGEVEQDRGRLQSRDVLEHVHGDDLDERVAAQHRQVVAHLEQDVGLASGVDVDVEESGPLVVPASVVESPRLGGDHHAREPNDA